MADEIIRQISIIRDTGATNMFDSHRVSEICDALGFDELQEFIAKNNIGYTKFILTGDPANVTI